MPAKKERPIQTVSQLTQRIKSTLESSVGRVWVSGEVSNLTRPQSGHVYFSLKDENAQIRSIIWRSTVERIKFEPQDGQKLICGGRLDVYPPRGEYQLVIDRVEPVGEGALQIAFKKMYERLAKEGLFDPEFKKPIPTLPLHIAVVTSPTGAAIVDFLKVLTRRWPNCHVSIIPTPVQGDTASGQIARSILALSRMRPRPDVVVVTRGGGSIEDLWCFNEEAVIRAIFECPIPVVSAIGHEIDITLSDLVADHRAATPSEAAEQLLPQQKDVVAACDRLGQNLNLLLQKKAEACREQLNRLANSTAFRQPFQKIDLLARQLDDYQHRLQNAQSKRLRDLKEQTSRLAAHLESVSPLGVLSRGYSITQDDSGNPIVDDYGVEIGDEIVSVLHRGKIASRVTRRITSD